MDTIAEDINPNLVVQLNELELMLKTIAAMNDARIKIKAYPFNIIIGLGTVVFETDQPREVTALAELRRTAEKLIETIDKKMTKLHEWQETNRI